MNTYIVNESSSNIRALARQALKGQWKPAVLAILIYLVCICVPTIIIIALFGGFSEEALMSDELMAPGEGLSTVYSILVSGAFTFGLTVFFIDLVREKKKDIGSVFSGFGYYFKTLGLYVVMSLFIVLWMLLLIVPGIIAAFRYSQAFYILADDPSKGIMQCLRESSNMMKGNKAKYFCMELSFIGWYLVIYAIIVIPSIVAVSLMIMLPGDIMMFIAWIILGLGVIAGIVGSLFLMVYVLGATTVFYEMANGNLRPAEAVIPPLAPQEAEVSGLEMKVDDNNNYDDKIEF